MKKSIAKKLQEMAGFEPKNKRKQQVKVTIFKRKNEDGKVYEIERHTIVSAKDSPRAKYQELKRQYYAGELKL